MKKPIVLTILDGYGLAPNNQGNAIAKAKKPNLDLLFQKYPHCLLHASGASVGLPEGQMGNSEVGHLNIGAGKVVHTGLSLINKSIANNKFKINNKFLEIIKFAQLNNSTIHIMGLLSPGGVHSHENHLWELLDLMYEHKIKKVSVHVFGDGRDVKPASITSSLIKLYDKLNKYNYDLASIMGRVYAMDRDKMFDKTSYAYDAILGQINNKFSSAIDYVEKQYKNNITDEFLEPAININDNVNFLKDNDAVIFFNFRPDRARQLSHLLVGSNLYDYNKHIKLKNIKLLTMMKYEGIDKATVAYEAIQVKNPLGKVIANNDFKQLRIAETQKYAHVTFFMDGGNDIQLKNSDRILIESKKIKDFSEAPEMSAIEITDKLIDVLPNYDLVIVNYANPDMVGHTGVMDATIKAIEILDTQIGRLYEKIKSVGGIMMLTSDHGNAEIMLDELDNPSTKHTTSDVPFLVTDLSFKFKDLDRKLANLSPTILKYMNIDIPDDYEEESLF